MEKPPGSDEIIESLPFQDEILNNHCYGCGPSNQQGLKIKSFWEGEDSVCNFEPRPYHMAGPRHILNGGVIATVIDCHCICTAIADAYRRAGRPFDSNNSIWYATGLLDVKYLRPASIEHQLVLRAKIIEVTDKKTVLNCMAFSGDEKCAQAEVVAVRVPDDWR